MSSRLIRWGILGCGRISADLCAAVSKSGNGVVKAVAARSAARSAGFAEAHGVERSYGSYEELLRDDEVDAVYVGTLNDDHVPTAVLSLDHGKPTLLEKPAAPSAAELERVLSAAAASGAFFQEAYWTRFMPATRKLRELIESGALGEISYVHADIGFVCDDPPDGRMYSPRHYGGGLMDVGVYPVQFATLAFGSGGPVDVQATGRLAATGVDAAGAAQLRFGCGGIASLSWSLLAESHEELLVVGSKGRARLAKPLHCSETLTVELAGGARGGHDLQQLSFPHPPATGAENYPNSQALVYQVEAVGEAIANGQKETADFTWQDSRRNVEIVEEIRRQIGVAFDVDDQNSAAQSADERGSG